MKRVLIVLSLVTVMLFATQAMSADREAIRKNVDEVVNAIDGGKDAKSYAADAFTPYVFIMEANGNLVVQGVLFHLAQLFHLLGAVIDGLVQLGCLGILLFNKPVHLSQRRSLLLICLLRTNAS